MLINGVDARIVYGFAVESAPGWLDAPPRQTPSAQVLRRGGARVIDKPREQPRQLTLRGTIMGSTAADARDKADALKLALNRNSGAQLTFDDEPTRYIIARCEGFRAPPSGASMLQNRLTVEATMTAHDPFFYDLDTADVILWSEPGDTLTGETAARSTTGNQFDQNGVLRSAAINTPRNDHYINGVRTALRERATTNIVVSPRDLTNAAWIATGITPLLNVTGIDNVANASSRITATAPNGTILQTVVSASALRAQSAFVKRAVGSGTLEMTTDGGTTWTVVPVGANYARVKIPTQTVTNPQFGFRIATSGDSFGIDYVQNESTQDPTSPYIGSRGGDLGAVPWPLASNVVPLTIYVKYVEGTTDTANQRRIFRIGASDNNSLILYRSGGSARLRHNNGTTTSEGTVTMAAVVAGDTVELRGVFRPDGSTIVGISINGGAETVGAASAAIAILAWGAQNLEFPPNSNNNDAYIVRKFLRGERTLTQARAATRPVGPLFTDTATQMPLGTGVIRPQVRIDGASVNPLIALIDSGGNTVATMALTVTTVAGDVLIIDMDAKTIQLNGVNRLDLLTTGDFFSIDPADTVFAGAAGPNITTTSGALSVIYRRTWR